jgi:hypothetical protein
MATKKSEATAKPKAPRHAALETDKTNFIFYANPTVALVCVPADGPMLFSLEAAAGFTGVHPDLLRYYCRIGLIESVADGLTDEPAFDESALQEVRRLEHYRRHLGVCRRALPLLCELRRKSERQHIEIGFLCLP